MSSYRSVILIVVAAILFSIPLIGQSVPDRNVNMVSGTVWPGGDPFLQRQNEPSIAVSTRNPLHLLAGSNDYRSVDIPGALGIRVIGDAWLGVYRSYDGGNTWRSGLLPFDLSPEIYTLLSRFGVAGADPVVRSGPNGVFYYGGLIFTRDATPRSGIFIARYIDFNDKEAGEPIRFAGARLIDFGSNGRFVDKPWISVDIPRSGSTPCTLGGRTFPGHSAYIAYTAFPDATETSSELMFSASSDCGAQWSSPQVISGKVTLNQGASVAIDPASGAIHMVWRRVKSGNETNAIMHVKSTDGGKSFSKPAVLKEFNPFEQGTTGISFRTTAYPSIAIDGNGRIHAAWSQRAGPDGDGRIVVSTSADGTTWSTPILADPAPATSLTQGRGHQFMPSLTFAGGKLTLVYYDLREDHTIGMFDPIPGSGGRFLERRVAAASLVSDFTDVFSTFVSEANLQRRHTIDVRVAQAEAAPIPAFNSARVSQYMIGRRAAGMPFEQLQYNPPNLPMFKLGTVPFMGDYLDVAGEQFVSTPSGWKFNTLADPATVFHAVWTDNRDVRPPPPGISWASYTPVGSLHGPSKYDGSAVPPCVASTAGMRNQNIYTARITEGLFAGSPGNAKNLGGFQRAFVVFVQNALTETRSYRLTIRNQPPGGKASFLQVAQPGFPDPLLTLDVTIPARSSIARSVFMTSSQPNARVDVDVEQISAPAGPIVPGGLETVVVLNPDIANPDIANPDIANPDIANPDIANAEVHNPDIANPDIANPDIANPDIANPDIANPDIANPDIANPDIANPDIANPDIANPDIANPDIANPDIANPDIANGSLSDTSWTATNDGNTTSSYSINLLLNGTVPPGFKTQLILHKTYKTPVARGCVLGTTRQTVLAANINNPEFSNVAGLLQSDITDPDSNNATVWLAPGESLRITLRVMDPDKTDGIIFNAAQQVAPVQVAHSINTQDLAAGKITPRVSLAILTTRPADAIVGVPYSATIETIGGIAPRSMILTAGQLPAGMALSAAGLLSGTASAAGEHQFEVRVTDADTPAQTRTQTLLTRAVDLLAIPSQTLANGDVRTPYSVTLARTGGVAPFTWTIDPLFDGALPPGLSMSPAGVITGTPTTAGTYRLGVLVSDGTFPAAQSASRSLSIQIGTPTYTITGNLTYNGAPVIPLVTPNIFWVNFQTNQYNQGQLTYVRGQFTITGLPAGSYGIGVHGNENTSNPENYPGDYHQTSGFTVPAASQTGITISLTKVLHLTSPHDNGVAFSDLNTVCPPSADRTTVGPVTLSWDAITEAASYVYRVELRDCPYVFKSVAASGTTFGTSVIIDTLNPTGPNEVYVLTVDAYSANQVHVGQIMTHGANWYGWDHRFQLVPRFALRTSITSGSE